MTPSKRECCHICSQWRECPHKLNPLGKHPKTTSCKCHTQPATPDTWEEEFFELFAKHDFTSPSAYAACKEFIRQTVQAALKEERAKYLAPITATQLAIEQSNEDAYLKAKHQLMEEGAQKERERILAALPQITISEHPQDADEANYQNGSVNLLIELRRIISLTHPTE